ncbi:hypothetical protein ACFL5X_02175 [Candidatus Omnitrophota bacterium]
MGHKKQQNTLCLSIADASISVTAEKTDRRFRIDGALRSFIGAYRVQAPDIDLTLHYGKIPRYPVEELIFEDRLRKVTFYRSNGCYIVRTPFRLLAGDVDFSRGDLYIRPQSPIIFLRYPLQHPLDKILMLTLFSRKQAAVMHACGVDYRGQGLLFVGNSNAGKSTMARLWKKHGAGQKKKRDFTVLNDDRIVIRKVQKKFWIYGTPWHGDARLYSPKKVPLRRIFFLRHSQANALRKTDYLDSVLRLVSCSLAARWHKQGIASCLDICAELAGKTTPCEFSFLPDKSALEFIKNEV